MCFLLFLLCSSVGVVFAIPEEKLTFNYENKIFTYYLSKNIKHSNQFDINYEINKLNRFGSKEVRQSLLAHLLNIGLSKEVALEYVFPNLLTTIKSIEKTVYIKEKSACANINTNTEKVFNIKPEIIGIKLNTQLLINNICNKYLNNSPLTFNLPIIKIIPQITIKDIEPYTYKRSDFSTNISSSSPDRKHNIKNALISLNKTEILPNEIFSFNKVVGKRTSENGYRNAKIIVNNEYVEGIGGGVCQVSSTLYNSALLAGLEIIEANKHSKQVAYVKQGFDAMVNYGSSDLKFKNNTNQKLTIITNYSSNNIRIRLFGENLNNTTYKLTNEITDIIEPGEDIISDNEQKYSNKVIYSDEYFYLKPATTGKTIKTYREKCFNGKCIEKQLLRTDVYKPENAIIVYGSKPRPVEPMPSDSSDRYSFDTLLET